MCKHRTVFLKLLLFSTLQNFAQLNQLRFNHLTTNEGLSQSVIHYVYTDTRGFFWISTANGINRFDGVQCLSNNQIAPGLENIALTLNIVEDKNNDIWIGSEKGLIKFSYTTNKFNLVKFDLKSFGIESRSIKAYSPAFVDNENNILVGINASNSFIYNIQTTKITLTNKPPGAGSVDLINPFKIDKGKFNDIISYADCIKDTLYIDTYSTQKKGTDKWEKQKIPQKDLSFNAYFFLNEAEVLLAGYNLFRYNFNTHAIEKLTTLNFLPLSIFVDNKKNIWFGTLSQGLICLDGKTYKEIAHFTHKPEDRFSISSNWAMPYIDAKNNLWVMSWGRGLNYCNLNDVKFKHYLTPEEARNNKTNNFIRGIVVDSKGNYYCNTFNDGIIQLNNELKFVRHLPAVPKLAFDDILIDRKDNLWFGKDGFYKYNLNTGSFIKIVNKNANASSAYKLNLNSDGNIMAGTYSGMWLINTAKNIITEISGIPFLDEIIVYTYEDKQKQLYKCINGGGFEVYMPASGQYKKTFTINDGITVKHIYQPNDSLLWIGTNYGLYLFNSRQLKIIKKITTAQGLPNNTVYAIMPDDKGKLWLSTGKGIAVYSISTETFTNYTMAAGLQDNEFNSHTAIKNNAGEIIFGGINGLNVIDPNNINITADSLNIQFTSIKTDSSINPFQFNAGSNELILSAKENSIEFQFMAIDYSDPLSFKLKYRLTGFDKDWVNTVNPGIARYVHVPAGTYTFEIIAANGTGIWSKKIKQLVITIQSHWWQSWWFKLTMATLLVSVIVLLIRQYVKRKIYKQKVLLEKQEAISNERERIIADLHDDVGATLSSMNIYGDLAGSVWDTKPQDSRKMIEKISVTTKDLMIRMSDIIWSMKPADEEKYTLEARLKNYSNELLTPKNIECDFDIDEKLVASISNPEVRKNILLIVKEAINNIAKYSEASNAFVSFKQQNETMLLTVSDNGKGYRVEDVTIGNGLNNIQQRCKQLQGICIFKPLVGEGVTIVCSFPMTKISHTS